MRSDELEGHRIGHMFADIYFELSSISHGKDKYQSMDITKIRIKKR